MNDNTISFIWPHYFSTIEHVEFCRSINGAYALM